MTARSDSRRRANQKRRATAARFKAAKRKQTHKAPRRRRKHTEDEDRGDLLASIAGFIVCGAILLAILVWMGANNADVEQDIRGCIARGGTPIVTGNRGWDDYHGCAGVDE